MTPEETLVSVGRAHGLLSKPYQRLITKVINTRSYNPNAVEHATQATARLLLIENTPGLIPPAVGLKTRDLLERVDSGIRKAVDDYHQAGGVLLAKEITTRAYLMASIAKHWKLSFAQPVDVVGELDDNLNSRSALAARALLKTLLWFAEEEIEYDEVLRAEEGNLTIPIPSIEALCVSAIRKMLDAYNNPNETIHKIAHEENK